jgi:hypothetical protein
MIYRDEKWFLDNWDNIFPMLLEKVIQFGYDKEQFLRDCNYITEGKKFNKQMIKNAMRWYKLLDPEEPNNLTIVKNYVIIFGDVKTSPNL